MTEPARFEIVATIAGWSARYIATAGPRVYTFTAGPYPNRRRALVAVYAFTGHTVQPSKLGYWDTGVDSPRGYIEVRDVDERPVGLVHGTHAGVNRGCPCELCRNFRAEYVNSGVPDGEAS